MLADAINDMLDRWCWYAYYHTPQQ